MNTKKIPWRGSAARDIKPKFETFNFTSDAHHGKAVGFDAIARAIEGGDAGRRLIRELRESFCEPDTLFEKLREIFNDPARLRGFCRALQKFIERTAS